MDEINENQYREGAIATQEAEPSNPDQIRKR